MSEVKGPEGSTISCIAEDKSEKLRLQTHLNFAASHESRLAARLRNSLSTGNGEESVDDKPPEESAALFNDKFNAETRDKEGLLGYMKPLNTDISESLAKLVADRKQHASAEEKEFVRAQLDALVDRVKGLRKLTAEATLFLPMYELRRAQEEVGKLLASVESTRAELAPRKKFAFRCRDKIGTRPEVQRKSPERSFAMGTSQGANEPQGAGSGSQKEDGPGLRGLSGEDVEVTAEEARGKDFNLADLHKCTVRILHALSALRIRRLTSSRVVCGAVNGPIYLEGCKDCVITVAGRQLRIHDSQGVHLYVLVASGPVIEDCSRLRFAPWGAQNPEHLKQLQEVGLSNVTNAWEDIKDFKWHRAQKSPNWDVIPEAERVTISSTATVATVSESRS